MNPTDFVKKYFSFAKETQEKTGISAIAILAQAALESGWGEHAPGNMFFGVKDTDGVNGNEQLLTTFEYSKSANLTPKQIGLVEITAIVPATINGLKYFKYTGKSYFRKYNTPEESFTDHTKFFFQNKRYKKALMVKENTFTFIEAISKAGYAQSPEYAKILKSIANTIIEIIHVEKL